MRKGVQIVSKTAFILLILLSTAVFSEPRVRPINWAQPIIGSSLGNFYKVDEGLYRSEQPNKTEFREISRLGISEILNLREYHTDVHASKGLSLNLHHIKMAAGSMTEEQIVAALKIIVNRKGPILVHCWHGSDRTGAIITAYRVVVQGWTKEQALEELLDGGYGYHAKVYPNIVALISAMDTDKITSLINSDVAL